MFERILFVCIGNICRSPMAEGLLRDWFHTQSIQAQVSSAGLNALINHPAAPFSQLLMQRRDIDIASHRARQLTERIATEQDLILVMTAAQKKQIIQLYPQLYGKVFLLAQATATDIPDPYRQDLATYEASLQLIEAGLTHWQKKLCMH